MTIGELRALCVMASYNVPHADIRTTLDILRYLTVDEREQAAQCYAAILGEQQLPANLGVRHAQPVLARPLQGTARMVRQGEARRILEARRDEA